MRAKYLLQNFFLIDTYITKQPAKLMEHCPFRSKYSPQHSILKYCKCVFLPTDEIY